jgi:hypothetical protein
MSSQEISTTWDAGAPFLVVGFYSGRYYQFIVVEKYTTFQNLEQNITLCFQLLKNNMHIFSCWFLFMHMDFWDIIKVRFRNDSVF